MRKKTERNGKNYYLNGFFIGQFLDSKDKTTESPSIAKPMVGQKQRHHLPLQYPYLPQEIITPRKNSCTQSTTAELHHDEAPECFFYNQTSGSSRYLEESLT